MRTPPWLRSCFGSSTPAEDDDDDASPDALSMIYRQVPAGGGVG